MKKLAIMALAFAASLVAQANYSGIYKGVGGFEDPKYGSVPATASLTLTHAGSSITGYLKIGNNPIVPVTSGSVSGTTITFAVNKGGGTGTLTVNGANLHGTLTSSTGKILNIVFTKQ